VATIALLTRKIVKNIRFVGGGSDKEDDMNDVKVIPAKKSRDPKRQKR
jgi:hypothetical protein